MAPAPVAAFPTPLDAYPPPSSDGLLATLADRVAQEPFNLVATAIFALAILHTFAAARFAVRAHRAQHEHDLRERAAGRPATPSIAAGFLHVLGEVEVVFGLWALVLIAAITAWRGWAVTTHYLNDMVNYTEAAFVVVVMAIASSRPVLMLAESALRRLAGLGGGTPAAWWFTILMVAPLLGSFVTEPAAMTIAALLLSRQFYECGPGPRLKYATLGLLFVNISIGGTLTHFAAPPVLMVARPWGWDTPFMLGRFGWRSALAVSASTLIYWLVFRKELAGLAVRDESADGGGDGPRTLDAEPPSASVPPWITIVHVLFLAFTVISAHYPPLFIGAFLIFLGFARATAPYQTQIDLGPPLLVGFFLGGLVIHGTLQGWWIAPVLASLRETPLFLGAMLLTSFNDNALITYLATLVPNLSEPLKIAVVGGAVAGGGLTVIANAPNPAGQALLGRHFGGAIAPLRLLLSALVPTLVAILALSVL